MRTNWMIVSGQHTDEEDASVSGEWKSRDIPPQETVFVSLPESAEGYQDDKNAYPFRNWDDFRSYQLEYGISCPIYIIEQAKKLKQLISFKYQIGDDEEEIKFLWIAAPGIYQPDTGLARLGKGEKTDRANGVFG